MPGRRRWPAGTLLARSFADADVRALRATDADAQSPANAGAVVRAYGKADAAAQPSSNAGAVASAYSCSDPRAVAVADAGSWQPDGGSRLRADPETDVDADAAADACADVLTVGQAYTDPDAAADVRADVRALLPDRLRGGLRGLGPGRTLLSRALARERRLR